MPGAIRRDAIINLMKWWRGKPARPADTGSDLARIRREPVWKFGEEIAYAIRLTGKDEPLVGGPAREPLSAHEALEQVEGLLSERFSLRPPIRLEIQPTTGSRWLVCTTGVGVRLRVQSHVRIDEQS